MLERQTAALQISTVQVAALEACLRAMETVKTARRAEQAADPAALPPVPITEAETRWLLIDVQLREAGWAPEAPNVREYPLAGGMPLSVNPSGRGFADYVLWGADGLPLAVVEAKKSLVDACASRTQAVFTPTCWRPSTAEIPITSPSTACAPTSPSRRPNWMRWSS